MATKKTSSGGAGRRGPARRATGRPSRTTSGSRSRRRVRSRPGLPTTIGAALGTLVVTAVLDLSWPARLGLVALVVVLGVGYLLWKHRAEIAAAADEPPSLGTEGPTPAG